jgi:hypothetical protein
MVDRTSGTRAPLASEVSGASASAVSVLDEHNSGGLVVAWYLPEASADGDSRKIAAADLSPGHDVYAFSSQVGCALHTRTGRNHLDCSYVS